MEAKRRETRLFHGLPAIKVGHRWLVFSPYAKSVAEIEPVIIDSSGTYRDLEVMGFFGEPSLMGPGQTSEHFQLTLIVTSDCNLRCKYCFVSAGDTSLYMDEDVARAAVRYALDRARGRKLLISFFGGEPSLASEIIRGVVGYARSEYLNYGVDALSFNITTNGVMPMQTLRWLIENNFFLTLSMDGVPRVQNEQRPLKSGAASSIAVERTIRALVEARHEFIVRSTMTDVSTPCLVEEVDYLASLGVSQLHVEAINLAGRAVMETKGQPMDRPSAELFSLSLLDAIHRGSEVGVDILNSAYMNLMQPSFHFCDGVGGNRVSVTYDGSVTTCLEVQGGCHPTSEKFIVGAYDRERDAIIVNQEKRSAVCATPIIDQNPACLGCFARYTCGGGCPIRNFHTTGDTSKVDPFRCEVISNVLPEIIRLIAEGSCDGEEV